jgi:hypothetical protein
MLRPLDWLVLLLAFASANCLPLADADAEVEAVNLGTAHEALYGLCLKAELGPLQWARMVSCSSRMTGVNTWAELDRFTDVAFLGCRLFRSDRALCGSGGVLSTFWVEV